MNVALRADRFLAFERLEDSKAPPRPQHISLRNWTREVRGDTGAQLKLRVRISERAAKSFEFISLFGRVEVEGEGRDVVEARIPRSEIEYYASRLLSVGTEVRVEAPPELVLAVREKALEIARLYD